MGFITQTSLPSDNRVLLTNLPCTTDVIVGSWVRFDEFNILIPAQADLYTNSLVVGLVEAKGDINSANVLVMGISKEIFTGLDLTKQYFLSIDAAGQMYLPPVSDQSDSVVLSLGIPASDKKFIVRLGQHLIRS